MRFLVSRLFNLLRAELKTEDAGQVSEYLQEKGVSAETAEGIVKQVQNSLQFYFSCSVFRKMEEQDQSMVLGLLMSIFEKYVVRFEPGYIRRMRPELCSVQEWDELVDGIDGFTNYYVSRSYTRNGIIVDLMDESGLRMETCEYWAELIEKNYLLLKLNYITEELKEIQNNRL